MRLLRTRHSGLRTGPAWRVRRNLRLLELADDDEVELVGLEVLLRHPQDVFLGDGVDALRIGVGVVVAQAVNLPLREEAADLRIGVEAHRKAAGEIQLGATELIVTDRFAPDALELATGALERIVCRFILRLHDDLKAAGKLVDAETTAHGVRQSTLGANVV